MAVTKSIADDMPSITTKVQAMAADTTVTFDVEKGEASAWCFKVEVTDR